MKPPPAPWRGKAWHGDHAMVLAGTGRVGKNLQAQNPHRQRSFDILHALRPIWGERRCPVRQAVPQDRCSQATRKPQARPVLTPIVPLPTQVHEQTRGIRRVCQMGERTREGGSDGICDHLRPDESGLACRLGRRGRSRETLDGNGVRQASEDRQGRRLDRHHLPQDRPDGGAG